MKTPLHYASEAGHAPVVQLLMEYGADPFETDNCGRNALHYAIYSGQTEIIETLIQISIEVIHEKDHAGRTPLHHAVFMESNQILMI
jgi:ankyrin repeat protein